MKKALVAAGIVTAVGVASISGLGMANAATDTSNGNGPMSGLIDAIATKFNLDKDEVQTVFNEQRTVMEAEREQDAKDTVAQLVEDGKLSQSQADAINAKRAELTAQREAERTTDGSKSAEERKAEREAHRTELDKWLTDNSISEDYAYLLMGGRGHGGGPGGPGGPRGDRAKDNATENTSDTTTES